MLELQLIFRRRVKNALVPLQGADRVVIRQPGNTFFGIVLFEKLVVSSSGFLKLSMVLGYKGNDSQRLSKCALHYQDQ